MCGAIPVVESDAEAYVGFYYFNMKDKQYLFDEDTQLKNYELCVQRLTIPQQDLDAEVERLLKQLV